MPLHLPSNPFSEYTTRVRPEWIDVNNHMNARFYSEVIYFAHELLTEALGLANDYVASTNCSKVVVESHLIYEREVMADAELGVTSWLLAVDDKRLHFAHELMNLNTGLRAAFSEQLDLHVDLTTRRVTAFSPEVKERLSAVANSVRPEDRPQPIGRAVRGIG